MARMKKRHFIVLLVCIVCIAVVTAFLWYGRERPFVEVCPTAAAGNYHHATLLWDELEGEAREAVISNEEFQSAFGGVRVKRGTGSKQTPSPAFELRLQDGQVTYSLVVGGDNSISVAKVGDNMSRDRTFWRDCDGELFSRLYTCHLNNGGTAIPEDVR